MRWRGPAHRGTVTPGSKTADLRRTDPADLLFSLLDLDFALGPWTFRGYLNIDTAEYYQASGGPLESDFRRGAIGDDTPGSARDMGGGAYLRRARPGGEGTLGDHIAYRAMFGEYPSGVRRAAKQYARALGLD